MSKSAKDLTTEWFRRVWNEQNEQAVYELMCEHCVVQGLENPELARQGFLNVYKAFNGILESIHIDIMEMVQEGDQVIGHAHFTAVHKNTKNKVDMVFSFSAIWKNGKISSARNVVDFVTMLSQMNLMDKATMAMAFKP